MNAPTPQARTLSEILRTQIATEGAIPFRDFMAAALYHPEFGYYSSGRARIGRKGDFFTSVSVGPLYGALLARQIAEIWDRIGCPASFDVVEQGAHDGTLLADVLRALANQAPDCAAATRPGIIEPSESWRARQAARLNRWPIRWWESVETMDPIVGVHFSNELLDAFPVHLVRFDGSVWWERFVTWSDDAFRLVDQAIANPALSRRLAEFHVPTGYETEVNLVADQWMEGLLAKVERGCVFIADYGYPRGEYYAPHRITGTLQAIAEHRIEQNPLTRPGEADLTAHVDFTAVAQAAVKSGARIEGYTDQHHFLTGLVRLHFPDGVRPSPSELRAFQTLSHPTMLGRAFKMLAVSRSLADHPSPLSGFSFACDPRLALGLDGTSMV